MSHTLIYHHDDNDGYLAAAIANKYLSKENNIKFYVGKHDGNFGEKELEKANKIYILDYSLPINLMDQYHEKIIWIDHHKTAIDNLKELQEKKGIIQGIRKIGKSGCLLTWEFFSPEKSHIPLVVTLVNDRDVWDWKFGEQTAAFHEISRSFMTDYTMWNMLLGDDKKTKKVTKQGIELLSFVRHIVDDYNKEFSWEGQFMGFPVVYVNIGNRISGELHKRLREDYPSVKFAVIFVQVKDRIKVGLYRQDHLTTPDLGKLAKKFGGGGHAAAAGFFVSLDRWSKLINE